MNAEPILAATLAALAGVAAASLAGPMTLGWPAGPSVLRRRMNALSSRRPGRLARLAGAGLLASLLVGGALAAYAAAPSAPERLPSQVVGVIGSGDELSLQLKDGQGTRSLKVGDVYDDGWTVQAINASEATLAKGGEVRRVGLNPFGALAAGPDKAPPTQVTIAGEDARLLAQAIARGVWDGQKLEPGLTLEETQRYIVLNERFSEKYKAFTTDLAARAAKAGVKLPGAIMPNDILSALGPQYAPAFAELSNKMADERDRQSAATLTRYGPVTVHVASPAQSQAATAAYGQAAWTLSNQEADGSYDLTMSAPNGNTGGLRYSMEVAANPPPLDSIQVMVATTDANGRETWNLAPQPPP